MIEAREVKRLGREAGFDLVSITSADDLTQERQRYEAWIAAGRHGEMAWITPERARRASSPREVLPRARSVISVGLAYWGGLRPRESALQGRIARYAWGRDYHAVLGERLDRFGAALRAAAPGEHRWYVDTGPVLDKALAVRAGLGWQGKNTNVLTERFGSFVLLGEILTTLPLQPDLPLRRNCGSCRLCLVACPTGALGPDYSIDSRRCISYLTIEHRRPIPHHLRPAIGNWVFGCDICQDVCPPSVQPFLRSAAERRAWAADVRAAVRPNGHDPPAGTSAPEPTWLPAQHSGPLYEGGGRPALDLHWLLSLAHEEYVAAFRGTAIRRAKVWMLRRNAAVALGNVGDGRCVPALDRALRADEHEQVRGHAAWALGELAARTESRQARASLLAAAEAEPDASVRAEITRALENADLGGERIRGQITTVANDAT